MTRIKDIITTAEIIHGIERGSFTDPWSAEAINAHLKSEKSVTLLETADGATVGYAAGVKLDCGEAELYRIAVLPEYRGRGLAKKLLARFIEKCGGIDIFLEVRSKNAAAIALYKSAGFTEISRRINYYGDDDAVIFKKSNT